MKELSLRNILPCLRGHLVKGNDNIIIKNVTTEPEQVKNNTLVFKLDGEEEWAYPSDKTTVIVTDILGDILWDAREATVILVDNINDAYWSFIEYYRKLFSFPVIGITGTCGKTTTTEMLKSILSVKYPTHATFEGNNTWHLSLHYLLGFEDHIKRAVFELGVEEPGDIDFMCKHFQPQVGILLNIGTYHLLGCKTQENYMKAKAELLEGLNQQCTLILNSDDENIKKLDTASYQGKIIYFGTADEACFRAIDIKTVKAGVEFTLLHQGKSYKVFCPGYGEHNTYNALAAIAAAHCTGTLIPDAVNALLKFTPVSQHLQIREGPNQSIIIDDTWNCTPLSAEAGLKFLTKIGGSKKTIAVLGYMPQLGLAGEKEYDRLGEFVAALNIDFLIHIDDKAKKIGLRAIELGFKQENVHFCSSANEVYNALLPLISPDAVILFKFPYKYRLSNDPNYRNFMKKMLIK